MELKYKEYGDNKTALIILHGLLGSRQNWHQIATKLEKNCNVIVPTLRNHGDSPHGPHSISLMAEDVAELIHKRALEKIHLLGHSMGGMVAMNFAMRYPKYLQSLIIVDTAPVIQLGTTRQILRTLLSLDLTLVRKKEDADAQLSQDISDIAVRQFLLQNLRRDENGSYNWQSNLQELFEFTQKKTDLFPKEGNKWTGPALFIGGSRSEYRIQEHSQNITHHFPRASLCMIEDAGHWVHFDNPVAFLEYVTTFLAENDPQWNSHST